MTLLKLTPPTHKDTPGPVSGVRQHGASPEAAVVALLVVDDNSMNSSLLSRRFVRLGYEVTVADSGRKALDLIAARPFDAVLLDVMMPELSGLQVLEEVRMSHSAVDLPIIMATALDQPEDVVRALKLGANDYVSKPFDFEVVLARLTTQLSLKRAKQEVDRLVEELELRSALIQKTFGRYLRDDIVATLIASPDSRRLGGERRDVTILLCDLRGFTLLTDGMPPERVMTLLNNHLGAMARIITRRGGMIDEFIGDGILAVFGAPTQADDDALRASACALEMQLAMSQVNAQNLAEGLPMLEMGIALHAGSVVVGNIGSEARAKYGVVGSNVSLAARIESSTVGGQILISETVARAIAPLATLGAQMTLHAKGFRDPITVHELSALGPGGELALPRQGEPPRPLSTPLQAQVSRLTDKQVDAVVEEGTILGLSPTGCDLRLPSAPHLLANLRILVGEERGLGEIYGKVVGLVEGAPERVRVRFTSLDPATRLRLAEIASAG
jgi:class 3 adenylate cyclase